jgi:hypothetical protein
VGEEKSTGQQVIRKVKERYSAYDVYDPDNNKIGSVDATYVNESTQREYIAVGGGISSLIPGTSGTHIIPVELCIVDNIRRAIETSTHQDAVKNSPALSGTTDLTPEYEGEIRSYYRL